MARDWVADVNTEFYENTSGPTIQLQDDDWTIIVDANSEESAGSNFIFTIGNSLTNRFNLSYPFGGTDLLWDHNGFADGRITQAGTFNSSLHCWCWRGKDPNTSPDIEVYKDGVSVTTKSVTQTANLTNTGIRIGALSGRPEAFDGQIGLICYIKTSVSDNMIGGIGRGAHPFGTGLAWKILYPMYGNDNDEPDFSGNGLTLTAGANRPIKATKDFQRQLLSRYMSGH